IRGELDGFFKEYDAVTDKLVFINLTEVHRKRVPTDLPTWHQTLAKGFKSNVVAYADKLFATSVFVDRAKLEAFLDKPSLKVLQKDLGYQTAKSAEEHAMAFRAKNPSQQLTTGMRLLVKGLQEMNPGKAFAPDANSTMRVTYGIVDGYKPADAVSYKFYTTSDGILEKHDDSNPEFVVPPALVKLLEKREFGRYANRNGELVTCFLHNLDITGGNSGSPVIDGDGNIVGIAFDGNWEAMSGDIAFEPQLQRTISVDIRYVLFIVDKLMGGSNIINELKFAEVKPKAQVVIPVEGKKEAIEVQGSGSQEKKQDPKPSLQKK
ncbi:MAG: S46 family peptidase, partial [Flavobacteriales bacterium]